MYEINGKNYIQKPLVWGQTRQLIKLLKDLEIPMDGVSVVDLVEIIGDKLPEALAIVLAEEGQSLKDKDVKALASTFEFDIPLHIMVKVIEDFFECNPTASYLEMVAKLIGGIGERMFTSETSSKKLELSSVEETSPSVT